MTDNKPEYTEVTINDVTVQRGHGGETHQFTAGAQPLTTQQGVVVSDDQNSLKSFERGPTLLEDHFFREKMTHFDHERIPERVVHARGYAAHGYFENYGDLSDITCADLFQRAGEKTDVFVRFSTVAGNKGSPDLARDVRGFAVKFYSKAGIWDLVGNNIPVFFIQDAVKFPDLIHAAKPEPDSGFPQAQTAHDNFWDFVSLTPESTNMLLWIMSDRTLPRSLRFMEGFGVHTFRLVTKEGKVTYVKFHWKPVQGLQLVVWNEAVKINGADPDRHRRDLRAAIDAGDFPEWELGLQLFDEEFADKFDFDVLDSTKLIPEELVPVRKVGKMVLNRNVDNFFAETEQVAFCTSHVVPGIDHSADPLLQGRNHSYLDTQLKRLGGPNFAHIPINRPRGCPVHHFQQDGHMAMFNPKGRANYEPNSWGAEQGGPRPKKWPKGFATYPAATPSGSQKRRIRAETFADHYSQAKQFYISQTEVEQKHIQDAFTFELSKVKKTAIRARVVSHLRNVDEDLAKTVADNLRLASLPKAAPPARAPIKLEPSPALSIVKNGPESFKGRKVGIVLADGFDRAAFDSLVSALEKEGAMHDVIAEHIGGADDSQGKGEEADETISGGPSVLYDAVALLIPGGSDAEKRLADMPPAKDFVSDAFAHGKFIAYTDGASKLFQSVDVEGDGGFFKIEAGNGEATKFVHACRKLRFWPREKQM